MGTQILGGGVVVLVAVLLWLVYLLPSIYSRSRYDAAERNALRLNRALRVLAETSETPDEVRVELSARQAHAQQRLARRAQAEVERLERERAELEAEQRRSERERELAVLEERRRRLEAEEAAREERRLELEAERSEREQRIAERRAMAQRAAAGRATSREAEAGPAVATAPGPAPVAVRDAAGARRIVRLVATSLAGVGLAMSGWGVWALVSASVAGAAVGGPIALALIGVAVVTLAVATLNRMTRVARRARARDVRLPAAETVAPVRRDQPLLNAADRGWTPRSLPTPLASTSGSRAASVAAAQAARDDLLRAARDEALRERADEIAPASAPVPITAARPAEQPAPPAAESPYARMGYVDDAEIEGHVRDLLARRVAG